jgi:hypothetical protein
MEVEAELTVHLQKQKASLPILAQVGTNQDNSGLDLLSHCSTLTGTSCAWGQLNVD